MKKIMLCCLAATLVLSFAACSKNDKTEGGSASQSDNTGSAVLTASAEDSSSQAVSKPSDASDVSLSAEETTVPGTLYQLNLEEGQTPIIKALKLMGNCSGGTADDAASINGKDYATENIRFIFELNEWINIVPETDNKTGISVYAFKHQTDASAYKDTLPDDTESLAMAALEEDEEKKVVGELYINPDEADAGYYDLVFVYENKPVAKIMLKLFDAETLRKSDAELQKIMDDDIAAAKATQS